VTPQPKGGLKLPHLGEIHYLAKTETRDGASQTDIVGWMARHGRRYDLVHYHAHADRTFLGSWFLKLIGRRTVQSSTLDDSVEGLLKTYRPLFRPLARMLFSAIDCFVAISPKLFAENNRFLPAKKSVLIPIGIVIPELSPEGRVAARRKFGITETQPVLVSVGGLCARKDQMTLVRAMPALVKQNPDLLLLLVGPPLEADYCAAMEKFVTEQGLKDHVRFMGYAEAPWDYYKAADIMVFASREEGFGTVVIEAMAHGLPVVARRLPGVNDAFIAPGTSGYLFDRDEEYAAYAGTLLSDETLRRRMGEAGRAFVAAHYDIKRVAASYLEVYGFPGRPE
jgi:glycosyltransferase involved in cell wall biosynthesis